MPAFEAAAREAHLSSVMCAYSALYGKPDWADPFRLTDLLRRSWGFDGLVVSDGGAIWDVWATAKPEQTVAATVRAGTYICSGNALPKQPPMTPADWAIQPYGWLRWRGL